MTRLLYALCGEDPARQFSPHVWKVVMALAHKGLAWETAPVPFTGIPAIEGGATKTVPLLRDGDNLVSDSFAIALYLEEAYPDAPSLFGGETPLFADYIVFGALQWLRTTSPTRVLAAYDPVSEWFERLLDLYEGVGRRMTAA